MALRAAAKNASPVSAALRGGWSGKGGARAGQRQRTRVSCRIAMRKHRFDPRLTVANLVRAVMTSAMQLTIALSRQPMSCGREEKRCAKLIEVCGLRFDNMALVAFCRATQMGITHESDLALVLRCTCMIPPPRLLFRAASAAWRIRSAIVSTAEPSARVPKEGPTAVLTPAGGSTRRGRGARAAGRLAPGADTSPCVTSHAGQRACSALAPSQAPACTRTGEDGPPAELLAEGQVVPASDNVGDGEEADLKREKDDPEGKERDRGRDGVWETRGGEREEAWVSGRRRRWGDEGGTWGRWNEGLCSGREGGVLIERDCAPGHREEGHGHVGDGAAVGHPHAARRLGAVSADAHLAVHRRTLGQEARLDVAVGVGEPEEDCDRESGQAHDAVDGERAGDEVLVVVERVGSNAEELTDEDELRAPQVDDESPEGADEEPEEASADGTRTEQPAACR